MRVRGGLGPVVALLGAIACAALLAPAGAGAATVVNGDFESGSLQGWDVYRSGPSGGWFAYKDGKAEPVAKQRGRFFPPEPPQGEYAAVADEVTASTMILSQEVVLEPGRTHFLSLLAYHLSLAPFAVPDTLSVDDVVLAGRANQQFRIDVMRPGTMIESVAPADVLSTVFQTRPGDPAQRPSTQLVADLSALAGQAVRLRLAVAAHEDLLYAGADSVAITPRPPGPAGAGSDPKRFRLGKAKANRKNGTVTLSVEVPSAGLVSAWSAAGVAKAGASKVNKGKQAPRQIKPAQVRARSGGTVKLLLKPTAAAKGILREKGRLRARVAVTFKEGRSTTTATKAVIFKLSPRPARR
jgi:hypothetical protein